MLSSLSCIWMKGSSSAQSCFVFLYICYSYCALLVIKSSLCGHGCPHSSVFLDLRTIMLWIEGMSVSLTHTEGEHDIRALSFGRSIQGLQWRMSPGLEEAYFTETSSSHCPFLSPSTAGRTELWRVLKYFYYLKSETFNAWAPLQNTKA